MLFADLLSLHLVTFLNVFYSCNMMQLFSSHCYAAVHVFQGMKLQL